ncbi:lysophospholipase [bacterium]|nr:lysophospholipase [bacterium]
MKSTKKQDTIIDRKGRKVPICSWIPVRTLCQIVVVHGFSEHMVYYQTMAKVLSEQGIAIHMMDLPGHGMAGGRRGHIDAFEEYLDNLDQLFSGNPFFLKSKFTFLLGHSLGGLVAAHYCLSRVHVLKGLILSSPLIGFSFFDTIKVLPLARYLARNHRNEPLPKPAGVKSLSRNPDQWEVYYSDPCRGRLISPNLYLEVNAMSRKLQQAASAVTLPLLMFVASKDSVVSPEAAQSFFSRVNSDDKSLVIFTEAMHELFQEQESGQILEIIQSWIRQRI